MNGKLIGLALSGALLLAACGGTQPAPSAANTTKPTVTLAQSQEVAPDATTAHVTGKIGGAAVSERTATYSVDGAAPQPLALGADGSFAFDVTIPEGAPSVVVAVVVKDKSGDQQTATQTIGRAQSQTVTVSGVVAIARAGAAVAGATVRVEGTSVQTTTDAQGRFSLQMPVSKHNLLITKADYAATRVENVDTNSPQQLEEILQRAFDPKLPSTPPTVTIDLKDGATIGASDLNIHVTTKTASPDVNAPYAGIASIAIPAGSSGYLNAGLTRSANLTLTGDDTFTFKRSDLAAFEGNVHVHVVIYDFNGNRTHIVRYVKATGAPIVAPANVAPTAITFADTGTFGALSKNPNAAGILKQFFSSGDGKVLNALRTAPQQRAGQKDVGAQGVGAQPQAAPEGTVMWVDVNFGYDPAAGVPRAFDLYRSFDGTNYSRVQTAAPARLKVAVPEGQPDKNLYVFRDTSAQLTPGRKTYYKVRAVGEASSQDSGAGDVTPLDRYRVELVSPAQAATGVDRIPVFRWKTFGASDKELLSVLVFDRTEAEDGTPQYVSDLITGGNSLVYNADGQARTPRLQAYHAYDWQMAAATSNAAGTAFSIGADFFNIFGLTAFPVKGGPVNEFVTGGL